MVKVGGGGFSFEEIYRMPNWLRNFIYNRMLKEQEEQQKEKVEGPPVVPIPEFLNKPDYKAKTRSK